MDLEARPLRCFIAVAELGSFGRAALRMNVSQPALSATIKELERRLGFTLFSRSSRQVQLTPEGKLFLGNARRYVRESDILRQSWQEIGSNDLRISAAFHTGLISERNRVIEGFLTDQSDVQLQILNDHHSRGLAKLAQGEVDLVIALEPENSTSDIELTSGQIEHRASIERIVLSTRKIGLLVPEEHPLAKLETLHAHDLCGWEIVAPNRFHGVALSELVRFTLDSLGAKPIRPPEGNAIGVERYGNVKRLPAVTLNWFATSTEHPSMLNCGVDDLGSTSLSLIRLMAEMRPSAARFWNYARGLI